METGNLTDELSRQAALRPEAPAILLPARYVSFRQLEALTWNAATYLRRSGVNAGDVVGLLFANEPGLLVTMLATARIGATIFSIPRSSPSMQQVEMAEQAGVRQVLTDMPGGGIAGLKSVVVDIDALARTTVPIDTDARDPNPQAPWLIITGSGSTGRPKQFPVTHRVFHARMSLYSDRIAVSPNDCVASLIHSDYPSSKNQLLNALFSGASICLFDRSRMHPVELCRRHNVTVLYAVVVHLETLLQSLRPGARNLLGSLRALVPAGSVVSDDLRQRVVDRLTPNLFVRYGTTETGPISDAAPHEVCAIPGTVGRPLSGVELEVVDDAGVLLAAGSVGQIRIRSPGMIDRYPDDDACSKHTFRNGWFYPDDLGMFSADGQLIFMGRADQMMIMDGINIYPAEIESVLSRHPAVSEVAAIPVRSEVHQDIPVCAVSLRQGATASEQELFDFAFQRLGTRHPRRIVILDEFPRSEQGKRLNRQLGELVSEKLREADRAGGFRPTR